MSVWVSRIAGKFPVDLSRIWIACDPDRILLDERIIRVLRTRGFNVAPFEDSVSFRVEYEECYRKAWDREEEGAAKALIVQLPGNHVDMLPWDIVRDARRVQLSLAELLPDLSYGVVRHIGSEHYDDLFDACRDHSPRSLGESETKEFILACVFHLDCKSIVRPAHFWRELLRLHFRDAGLPDVLSDHVAVVLAGNPEFQDLPVARLLSSKGFALRVLQNAWLFFMKRYNVNGRPSDVLNSGANPAVSIPFEDPDIRGIVGAMFIEGMLRPVDAGIPAGGIPNWVRAGLKESGDASGREIVKSVETIGAELPGEDASHRDWIGFAHRLGEAIYHFHSLKQDQMKLAQDRFYALQREADGRFKEWVFRNFADLSSLPIANGPVMLHHVPRFLAMNRSGGKGRVAMLVFDGLAMDQWVQIREHLAGRVPSLVMEESACFAWIPSLTSVSRQALFSGLRPREFNESIDRTDKEERLWKNFWEENGAHASEIFYRKGLKHTDQLPSLEDAVARPKTTIAGIVVDMVDEIAHGATLGKRGVVSQINAWCETGFVESLLELLAKHRYRIYLTADHGNIEVEGIGRVSQGVVPEHRGERVRAYRSIALADAASAMADSFRFDLPGLPADYRPLYADGRGAFVSKGERIVAHGGISVEEVVVPFVEFSAYAGVI